MGELKRAVQEEIDSYGPLAASALAAAAIDLAERLSENGLRPAAAALLHAQLRACLTELRALAPPPQIEDGIDEVAAQREERLKAAGLA